MERLGGAHPGGWWGQAVSIAKTDFSGGITLSKRVSHEARFAMSKISGYTIQDGRLVPEGLVAKLSVGDALEQGCPAQVPFTFIVDGEGQMVVRDVEGTVYMLIGRQWTPVGEVPPVLSDAIPCRYGKQVIIPAVGEFPRVWALEPGSPGTQLRPLSLKSPADYTSDSEAVVTPSAHSGLELFDCDDANVWTAVGAGCTVDNTVSEKVFLTVDSTTPASTLLFTKSLGDTGIALSGKQYLVLDLVADGQPQTYYTRTGVFANDNVLYPSGYLLRLYSDTACTTLLMEYAIPNLMPLSRVHRVCLNIGLRTTEVVKGVGIASALYWDAPDSGEENQLTLYSGAFDNDWEYQGNFLYPVTVNAASPLTDDLPPDGRGASSAVVLHSFSQAVTDFSPALPLERWRWCLAARDTLGETAYNWMVSNPADATADTFSDPWRTYSLAMTLPESGGTDALDDYGDYLQYAIVYRSIFDTPTWGDYTYIGSVAIATSMSFTDSGQTDVDTLLGSYNVPEVLELTNDYLASARFVVNSQTRLWLGCLDLDPVTGKWRRPTAWAVASYGKSWAFPTTVDEDSPVTDGSELDGYAQTGAELRGAIARNDEVYVWLDNEFGVWRGNNPVTGYRWVRLDSIGAKDGVSIQDCRSSLIWHSGKHFYRYAGGLSEPISIGIIEGSWMDWRRPHGSAYTNDTYFFWCYYDEPQASSPWVCMAYHLSSGGWRIRYSEALDLVGICPGEADGEVWGLTADGEAVSLFAGTTDYGAV